MDTQKRTRKAWTALGILALTAGLVAFPVSATTVNTNVSVPVKCCPQPSSAPEQVVDGAEALVSTGSNAAQSQSPLAQPSPLPTPGLTADPESALDLEVPTGKTNSGDPSTNGGDAGDIGVRSTTSPSPGTVKTTDPKSTSLAKCATCTPNLKVKASGLANVVEDGSGAAAAAAGDAAEAGSANRDYKDLTSDGEATPPAAVPGFGPAFALAGLALLVWVRRRASG